MEIILSIYVILSLFLVLLTEIFSLILVSEFRRKYRKLKFTYIWTFLACITILGFTIVYFL